MTQRISILFCENPKCCAVLGTILGRWLIAGNMAFERQVHMICYRCRLRQRWSPPPPEPVDMRTEKSDNSRNN